MSPKNKPTCKKCGCRHVSTKWDAVFDMLDHKCGSCGYTWSTEPLDKRAEKGKSDG